jgi:hypothetical protein
MKADNIIHDRHDTDCLQEFALNIPETRELTSKERLLLERLLVDPTEGMKPYVEQLPNVTVASRCSCGCPSLGLAVSGGIASPSSHSLILAEAGGVSPEGISFGIILHAREGLISELEVYPIGGEGAFTLPGIDHVDFHDAT